MTVTDSQGRTVPVKLIDNHDKTFRVDFELLVPGVYTANVTFAGVATPASPYKITAEAAADVSKVQVRGLPRSESITQTVVYIGVQMSDKITLRGF